MEKSDLSELKVLLLATKGILNFGGYFLRIQKEINILNMINLPNLDLMILANNNLSFNKSKKTLIKESKINHVTLVKPIHILKIILSFRRYDLIHAQNLIAGLYVCFLSRFLYKKPKIILDYHGVSPEENYFLYHKRLLYYLYKLFERIVLKVSNSIIVVSESFKEYLIDQHDINKEKIFILRNFIEESISSNSYPNKIELRKRLKLPQEKIIIIYSGSFKKWQEEESVKTIANFVYKYRKHFFLIILSSDSKLPFEIENFEDNWLCVKNLERKDVFDYLKASNIGVLIRKNNLINFVADPSKLSEYLVCGLKIFASGIGDLGIWMKEYNLGSFFIFNTNSKTTSIPLEQLWNLGRSISYTDYNNHSIQLASNVYSEQAALKTLNDCYHLNA